MTTSEKAAGIRSELVRQIESLEQQRIAIQEVKATVEGIKP